MLIPYGLDANGGMTHVADVPRGKDCGLRCPSCDAPLVARKGPVKQHHLAHASGKPTCEGWLHSTAKMLLYQRIAGALAGNSALPIQWHCHSFEQQADRLANDHDRPACTLVHQTDLLRKRVLDGVRIEQHLAERSIRPDICVYEGDIPRVLIEVVDTHAPERVVIETKLPVLEVHISEAADLAELVDGTVQVSVLHNYPCPDPICKICQRRKSEGCRYCDRCQEHVPPEHEYCPDCTKCADDGHWHRYCSQCDVMVMDREAIPGYGGDGSYHQHCEGCGRLLYPMTRNCGCCWRTFCAPCWRRI